MRELNGKKYWLVGASEGLGRAIAEKLSARGVELVLSARSEDRLSELAEALPGKTQVQVMDVADQASVDEAADAVGPVDGMVYLAGVYWPLSADEWQPEQAATMAEVNYVGAMRAVGAVMPAMVERDAGHIVLTGSLSGFRGVAGAAAYGSSKAGVMYLAEGLHADLRKTGVDVQLVNPGFIRTRLTEKNDFTMPFIMDAGPAADEFVEHMLTERFKHSYPLLFSLLFRTSQFLPDWAHYGIFGR